MPGMSIGNVIRELKMTDLFLFQVAWKANPEHTPYIPHSYTLSVNYPQQSPITPVIVLIYPQFKQQVPLKCLQPQFFHLDVQR